MQKTHLERKGSAVWMGDLKDGKGRVTTESESLSSAPYSFTTRFGQERGTNPEELVAAAHAACFSMAFSGQLQTAGFHANRVDTSAVATLEKVEDAWSITELHLDVVADVPGIETERFTEIANEAKKNCPISRLLNAKITLSASLQFGERARSYAV